MKEWGVVLLLGIILACAGCGEAPKPTKVPISPTTKKGEVSSSPLSKAAPAPELKIESPSVATYTYDPKGKTDPFKPLYVDRVEKAPEKKIIELGPEGATPLERVDLAQLRLVALVWSIPAPKAMVEDATGKGYILSVGTSIGKYQGKVSQINSTGVVVTEKYIAPDGKIKNRDVPLNLYPDQ